MTPEGDERGTIAAAHEASARERGVWRAVIGGALVIGVLGVAIAASRAPSAGPAPARSVPDEVLVARETQRSPHVPAPASCGACHACENPTHSAPCLRECLRPRDAASKPPARAPGAASGPDVVILDELEDLYVPVRFDHKAHASMTRFSGDCTTCHHHTPAGGEHPLCSSCHAREVVHEDIAQPGLKGAYHRQCLACHTEWDHAGSCEVCHEKKAGGALHGTATAAAVHSHIAPLSLEELIVFKTSYAEGDSVPFHHKLHSTKYEPNCAACHSEQSCTRCHVQGEPPHPMGDPGEIDMHETCFRCHSPDEDPCHPDDGCAHCHGRGSTDLFSHDEVGWDLARHHRHLSCDRCHGDWQAPAKLDARCESCHTKGWSPGTFEHKIVGVTLDEIHREIDCASCHASGVGKPAACDACHDDGRSYDAKKGFGG
ncbi:MAG: cytochrome c3 family protein [bacterium]